MRTTFRIGDLVEAREYLLGEGWPVTPADRSEVTGISGSGEFIRLWGREDFLRASAFRLVQRPVFARPH